MASADICPPLVKDTYFDHYEDMLGGKENFIKYLEALSKAKAKYKEEIDRIMKHLVVPPESTCNHDNGFTEDDETHKQLGYYHGLVKEQPCGKYSLSVQTSTGLDICLHNVKITGKGCRWFFAEKITINDEIVAADFFREEFGLYTDLLSIKFYC